MIRAATPADVPAMAAVFLASWDAALPTVARAHPDDTVAPFLAGLLGRAEVVVYADPEVAGLLALEGSTIGQLYLAPQRRGQGIGAALVGWAKARRPDGLQLWTFAVNGPARRFYARHGFVAVEATDGSGNEEGEPDVRYAWPATATTASAVSDTVSPKPA